MQFSRLCLLVLLLLAAAAISCTLAQQQEQQQAASATQAPSQQTQSPKQQQQKQSTSAVIELTPENWETHVTKNKLILVEFYAPWCPHCQQFAADYEKLAIRLKNQVPLARLNCEKYIDKCEEYNVPGFPVFKIFVYVIVSCVTHLAPNAWFIVDASN